MDGYIETFRGVVYPWHCDHQGHMTTMHYVGMFDQAFWHHLAALGFSSVYLKQHKTGFVDVRDVIEYRAEQAQGSLIVIETAVIRVGNTSISAFNRMLNSDTGDLAATSEKTTVYFDLEARQKRPLPEELVDALRAAIVEPPV